MKTSRSFTTKLVLLVVVAVTAMLLFLACCSTMTIEAVEAAEAAAGDEDSSTTATTASTEKTQQSASEEVIVEIGADGTTKFDVETNNNKKKKNQNFSWNNVLKQIFVRPTTAEHGDNNDSAGDAKETTTSNTPAMEGSAADDTIFESIDAATTSSQIQTNQQDRVENAESIWSLFLGGSTKAANTHQDEDVDGTGKEETPGIGLGSGGGMTIDTWETILMKARQYHQLKDGMSETPFDEKIQVVYKALTRVLEQMMTAFGDLEFTKFNLLQLWYVLQHEEHQKDPVWKRQRHRFYDPITERQALELADALYLNGVAYSDTCEEIEHYLKLFRNDTWFMVKCTTESTPEHPAHYIAVKRQTTTEAPTTAWSTDDNKNTDNDWMKWFQNQRLKKQEDKNSTIEVMFVVRATKSYMDILTDALLEATPYRGGYSHQGLLKSALWLYDEYKTFLPELLDASGNSKMDLYTIGYSLGAGAAALLTMEINENEEFDPRIRSKSIGFGTPATVTREQTKALEDTVTTLVVDSDCVARMSGATVYNAFLRGVTHNWTTAAMEDFNMILPFLKENLPLADTILSDDAVTNLRRQLQSSFNKQFQNVSTEAHFKDVILFPPGKCMHLYRGGGEWEWEGTFVPCEYFDEMDVVGRMLSDHLIGSGYYPAILGYNRQLKKDWHWKMEHDVMDVDYIRQNSENKNN